MSDAVVEYQGHAVASVGQVTAHVHRIKEITTTVMKANVHYGIIPGTKKNTLYKPGAEALCVAFHIAPTYPDESTITERFVDSAGLDGVRIRVKCIGIHQGSGTVVAEGLGSCSSLEEKYKWRKAYKREFDGTQPDRRRLDFGYNSSTREEYEIMQVRVETADLENTLLKMAAKRAMIAMTINATACSDTFTQDLEDLSKKVRDTIVDEESGGQKPGYKEPERKSGNGTVDKGTGEVTESPIASEGQLKHTTLKLEAAGKNMGQALVAFKLAPETKLTAKQCHDIVLWAQRPDGDPSKATAAEQDVPQ